MVDCLFLCLSSCYRIIASSQHPAGMATSVLLLFLYCNDATLLPVLVALYPIIIGYNATSTGNNVASLQYNNSNRTDVHAGRMLRLYGTKKKDTEINSQPFNGMKFILLQFKEQVVLLILQLGKQHSISCLS